MTQLKGVKEIQDFATQHVIIIFAPVQENAKSCEKEKDAQSKNTLRADENKHLISDAPCMVPFALPSYAHSISNATGDGPPVPNKQIPERKQAYPKIVMETKSICEKENSRRLLM